MNLDTVQKLLARECNQAGGIEPWAAQNAVTRGYVYLILNGKREPGDKILDALGLEKITTYKRRNGART